MTETAAQYIVGTITEEPMKKIKIMVPELLRARGMGPTELLYGAKLAPGTAYSLADPAKCAKSTAISFDVLVKLCVFLGVNPGEILKLVDDDSVSDVESLSADGT